MARDRVRTAVRWVLTTVGVAALVLLMLHLSSWQWHKHLARNTQITRQERNLAAPVAGLGSVLRAPTVSATLEWRQVRVTGTFDGPRQVVVTLRTVGGVPGSEVLTPLRTAGGTTVLVDRGFYPIPDDARPGSPGPAPAAPTGLVTATGWLRVAEPGSRAPSSDGRELTLTAIDPAALRTVLPYRVVDGYLLLAGTSPTGRTGLQQLTPPTYDTGPYLSYSVQWVIFCVIAVGGLLFLALDEFGGGRLLARLREPVPGVTAGAGPTPATEPATAPVPDPVASDAPVRPPAPMTVLAGAVGNGRMPTALPADFYDDTDSESDGDGDGDGDGDSETGADSAPRRTESRSRPAPPHADEHR